MAKTKPVKPAPAFWAGVAIALAVVAADQASKWWILNHVMLPPRRIEITPFFDLVMGWNRGVSFGLFNTGSPWNAVVLSVVALAIVSVLLVWLYRIRHLWLAIAIGFIIGGALGNVADRVRFGAVADFIHLHLAALGCPLGRSYCAWPAFNVADTMITIGAVMVVCDALFFRTQND